MTVIREEQPDDVAAIRRVNEEAFGRPEEADVVDTLRRTAEGLLSLVALADDQVVGHILFSPATVEGDGGVVRGMGLAPMAVLPDHQRQGLGTELVRTGLEILRGTPCPFIIVLGHADYYPRFGFERASTCGIRSQWDGVPDNAFMILVLDEAAMRGATGVARYAEAFDEAM